MMVGAVSLTGLLFGRDPKRTLLRASILVAVSYLTFGHLLLPIRGEGISMLPTFSGGQLGFVNVLAYAWGAPRRGDIVAVTMAGPRVMYVKRIVGLPGERLSIAAGVVYVDGVPLDEPYVAGGVDWELPEVRLGPDQYFLIGDNRRMAIRNHDLGAARRDRIAGKVLF
jgi:signal peptidase I